MPEATSASSVEYQNFPGSASKSELVDTGTRGPPGSQRRVSAADISARRPAHHSRADRLNVVSKEGARADEGSRRGTWHALPDHLQPNAASLPESACSVVEVHVGAALATLDRPLLVIAAEKDDFTPMWCSQKIVDSTPDAELLVLADGSHAALIEQPETINHRIDRFLRERVSASPPLGVVPLHP